MNHKDEQISTLTELNEELENYFQNTIIPQLFVDAELKLRKFTPPAMKQFKLKQDYIGKPMTEIQENFRFPTIIENIQQVIASGEILEKEIQTTDMRWYQMNILPYVIRRENRMNGVIITFVEITARVRDLKEQEKLIVEHELLLDTIAHDIKNPLTSLGVTIELLKKVPEKGMERFPILLEKVESSLKKMTTIIFDLVKSRLEDHPYQAVEELLDLENIFEDVRLTLAPQIADKGAVVAQDVEVSQVKFARRKLRSVIYNLVQNALKYGAEGRKPVIKISSYQEKNFVVISITDNGIGIAQENQAAIFDKYQRATDTAEGNGVGLYLVKQVLETSGGKITVESELGKGSTFRVYLAADSEFKRE